MTEPPAPPDLPALHAAVTTWYRDNARDLPWRRPGTSPWAVLVSEVMLQQTPVARVLPVWQEWVRRWPTPAAQAAARPAEVLRVWDRLGYPRRALRLLECATAIVARHGGQVPAAEEELRALPGVGAYTAAAVAAFAHGRRTAVLDTNVRRVLARAVAGQALPPPHLGRAEQARATACLPASAGAAVTWNVGLMELGALVCLARTPRCATCPLRARCAWLAAGRPADAHADRRRPQPFAGTDRQARGRILAHLRERPDGTWTPAADLLRAAAGAGDGDGGPADLVDPTRPARALAGLLADGLVAVGPGPAGDAYRLP
ncbi:A/G-specific adenine glycosylase [Georgenia sp. TF02-10]|uniref:A/G-specific adenine glycosylase n=1 Tax=Georgenia sp. TF02-10 TaxID=2917725 RepID=UPI001FA6FCA6|nr:A/G-specific adenine glycosylase [Georgenia sp. TF02-10]UNX54473.1 A/G-specific adenine glycosylase [Georgenia sp. TF02-10]